ncbi:MAG: hypothetical protein KGL35_21630 [Bradyrhizobium sp.]|nr:hypothetical protein [Bradyrhizobium sp.]
MTRRIPLVMPTEQPDPQAINWPLLRDGLWIVGAIFRETLDMIFGDKAFWIMVICFIGVMLATGH